MKQIHVKKDCGRWFVIFTVEFEVQAPPDMKALDVGIDVGVVTCRRDERRTILDTGEDSLDRKRTYGLEA